MRDDKAKLIRNNKAKVIRQARKNVNRARDRFFNSGDSLDAIDFLLRQDLLSSAYDSDSTM